ncbi:unnamed protein product [Rotaria sp. Silwood2]|nr:unnamed protein product [Rotaria sp. Silwood2]CAF4612502.1 unnamed protein product [Rotaria sp. Silwood2]
MQSSTATKADTLIDLSSRLVNRINIKAKEYNETNEKNAVTWLTILEEVTMSRLIYDDEKILPTVSLLGTIALQCFVNLKLKNQRPSSCNEFKDKLKSQCQSITFQEHLRQQLLQLRQEYLLQDYIHLF